MMITKRRHVFVADPNIKDRNGEDTIGVCCPLERANEIHHLPAAPGREITDRMLGERELE